MRGGIHGRVVVESAASWEIALPPGPSRLRGVSMAGFRDRNPELIETRVVPHPALTVVLEFGDGMLTVEDAGGRRRYGSLVAGLAPGAVGMGGRGLACVELRLSPLVARSVLGTGPADLGSEVLPLDELWGREAARIRERLSETPSWEQRFALVEALLARRAAPEPGADPEVAWAWRRIRASDGWIRVEDLAGEVGWSRARLWSRFRSQVGLPPKQAAKLVRFDRAAHGLAAGRSAARVAADCGYTDQSHLHRDVLAFTGMTPTALSRAAGFAADHAAYADR